MTSFDNAVESNYTRISEFLASGIEKIFLVIGKEEHSILRFMESTLSRASDDTANLVYRYELWEGENSRHFLYRWLQETASGKALMKYDHHADPIYKETGLGHKLSLLVDKDIRPLEVRFMEAIRFISGNLSGDQRLVLAVMPRTAMDETIFVDFFSAMLGVLPVGIKMILGQDETDVLAKKTDFSPSSRLVLDAQEEDSKKIRDAYAADWQSDDLRGRLIRVMAHLVHPVSVSLLSEITGENEATIQTTLESVDPKESIEKLSENHFRLAYQKMIPSIEENIEDLVSLDKQAVAFLENRILNDARGYPDVLYHSLGLSRLNAAEYIGNQTLSTCRSKLDLGGADMCEYELARALQLLGDTDNTLKTELMFALAEIQESLGRNQEALDTLNPTIDLLHQIEDSSKLQQALELKGRAAFSLRELETARVAMEESLKLTREMNRPVLEADILSQLGYIHFSSQHLPEAERLYREALESYRKISEADESFGQAGEAAQWSNLGHTFYAKGEFSAAEEYHRKSLEIYAAMGDQKSEANQWGYIGHTLFGAKAFDKANEAYEKAAALEEEMGEHRKAAQRHANVGHSMYVQRNVALAEKSFQKALDKYRDLGDPEGQAAQLSNLGIVKGDQGEFDEAIDYFGQSALLYAQFRDTVSEVSQIVKQGHVRRAQKRYDDAVAHYSDALNRFKEMKYPMGEGDVQIDLGQLYMGKNEWQNAIEHFNLAKGVFAKIGHQEKESLCLVLIGQVEQAQNHTDEALNAYKQAVDIYKKAENQIGVANVTSQIGLLQYERKNYGEAEQSYTEALEVFQEKEDKDGEANLLSNLGTLYFDLNELEKAREQFEKALEILRKIGNPLGAAGVLQNLSYVHEKEARYSESRECLEEAKELFVHLKMDREADAAAQRVLRIEEVAGKSLENLRSELFPGLSTDGKKSGGKKKAKIGRNDPCSCGSGKKYKKCCGA
jgi:tetratricopeptide (TPR) repeat protein